MQLHQIGRHVSEARRGQYLCVRLGRRLPVGAKAFLGSGSRDAWPPQWRGNAALHGMQQLERLKVMHHAMLSVRYKTCNAKSVAPAGCLKPLFRGRLGKIWRSSPQHEPMRGKSIPCGRHAGAG